MAVREWLNGVGDDICHLTGAQGWGYNPALSDVRQ
jgi:hypothetical protein